MLSLMSKSKEVWGFEYIVILSENMDFGRMEEG